MEELLLRTFDESSSCTLLIRLNSAKRKSSSSVLGKKRFVITRHEKHFRLRHSHVRLLAGEFPRQIFHGDYPTNRQYFRRTQRNRKEHATARSQVRASRRPSTSRTPSSGFRIGSRSAGWSHWSVTKLLKRAGSAASRQFTGHWPNVGPVFGSSRLLVLHATDSSR